MLRYLSLIAILATTRNHTMHLALHVFRYDNDAVWVKYRTIAAQSIDVQGRASGTRLTTAEHRTHNLPVPSEYATCYATDVGNLR